MAPGGDMDTHSPSTTEHSGILLVSIPITHLSRECFPPSERCFPPFTCSRVWASHVCSQFHYKRENYNFEKTNQTLVWCKMTCSPSLPWTILFTDISKLQTLSSFLFMAHSSPTDIIMCKVSVIFKFLTMPSFFEAQLSCICIQHPPQLSWVSGTALPASSQIRSHLSIICSQIHRRSLFPLSHLGQNCSRSIDQM